MLTWLKAFWASVQVFGEIWKAYKVYVDAVEQAGAGAAKREAVFALMGHTFEVCEKYTVDTPLDGADIRTLAERVWGVYEAFCVAIGKFRAASTPAPSLAPEEEAASE